MLSLRSSRCSLRSSQTCPPDCVVWVRHQRIAEAQSGGSLNVERESGREETSLCMPPADAPLSSVTTLLQHTGTPLLHPHIYTHPPPHTPHRLSQLFQLSSPFVRISAEGNTHPQTPININGCTFSSVQCATPSDAPVCASLSPQETA